MSELVAIIMALEVPQLIGMGIGSMGAIGLISYKILKKKQIAKEKTNNLSFNSEPEFLDGSELKNPTTKDTNSDKPTTTTQNGSNKVRPKTLDSNFAPIETSSSELLASALVYDGYGSTEEALDLLKEAVEKETHSKEKVRLKVIYKYYTTKKSNLSELINKYPTFLTSIDKTTQQPQEEQKDSNEHIDIFTAKAKVQPEPVATIVPQHEEPIIQSEPIVTISQQSEELTIVDFPSLEEDDTSAATVQILPKKDPIIQELHEEILSKIATDASNEDDLKLKTEENNISDFFAEFGELAKQIQTENIEFKSVKKVTTPTSTTIDEDKTASTTATYDIWVNYMILNNGKTNLKNTFVHLENPWGTIAAINEIQTKLNKEMGSDQAGLQIPWAIISVLPLKD
jgi:hypothetical protein